MLGISQRGDCYVRKPAGVWHPGDDPNASAQAAGRGLVGAPAGAAACERCLQSANPIGVFSLRTDQQAGYIDAIELVALDQKICLLAGGDHPDQKFIHDERGSLSLLVSVTFASRHAFHFGMTAQEPIEQAFCVGAAMSRWKVAARPPPPNKKKDHGSDGEDADVQAQHHEKVRAIVGCCAVHGLSFPSISDWSRVGDHSNRCVSDACPHGTRSGWIVEW